jgi:hypothetical protein
LPHGAHGTPAPTAAVLTLARRPGPVHTPLHPVVVRHARARKRHEVATTIAAQSIVALLPGTHGKAAVIVVA